MPLITKVELKSGTVYELGKAWPVGSQKEGTDKGAILVGLIWLCAGESEEDEDGAISMPPRYEIWCAPPGLVDHFFTPAQRALYKNDPAELEIWKEQIFARDLVTQKFVYCRTVFLSSVVGHETSWPSEVGLKEVIATVINPTFAPEEPDEDEPTPEMVQAPTNGEQKPAEPPAS